MHDPPRCARRTGHLNPYRIGRTVTSGLNLHSHTGSIELDETFFIRRALRLRMVNAAITNQ
ncbi:hypothetical protein CBOM_07538 [Ceraceosorus bombacis]|uniref:Uncharacterized protein n=1 Tax=Ceraceosorus bombacis TaxID=401625 RepID=A0A0P1BEW8_9BASI|nr:hypothetical protein CBOM_07538 [Ceraceosorus bombacis]